MWKPDLRFVILAAMNILKSKTCEWDSFELINNLTWIKFCILTSLLFLFAFVSVETLPLASPNNVAGFLRVRIKSFVSPSLLTCFLACLFLPQFLFWYLCPLILAWFWCFDCISKAFLSFASCVGNALSAVPDLNVTVEAAASGTANAGDEEEANVDEEGTLEV